MRWSLVLSRYNFQIVHVPGTSNGRADALSRRDQDILKNAQDDRLQDRILQLIKPEWIEKGRMVAAVGRPWAATEQPANPRWVIFDIPDSRREEPTTEDGHPLEALWPDAIEGDKEYGATLKAVQEGERKFPADLHLKVSITECAVTGIGKLTFRDRIWVPSGSDLRTKVLEEIHDSTIYVHPGREAMFTIIARQFYWKGLSRDIRTFVANCDGCSSNKAWRTL
jgi:hypothetical protein